MPRWSGLPELNHVCRAQVAITKRHSASKCQFHFLSDAAKVINRSSGASLGFGDRDDIGIDRSKDWFGAIHIAPVTSDLAHEHFSTVLLVLGWTCV